MELPRYKPYKREMPHSYALGASVSLELLRARPEKALCVLLSSQGARNEGVAALRRECAALQVPCKEDDRAIARLSPKGNCFAVGVYEKWADQLTGPRQAVLVRAADAGNVGTILRAALGFAAPDVALIAPCVDVHDPHVARSSMGALFRLRTKTYETFEDYRAEHPGYALYPFMLDGALALPELAPPREPYALVFGNEAEGLPPEFSRMGQAVRIPQSPLVDSLNLAVAAGIALYETMAR